MNFNEKLQNLRKEKKYSQEELAEMLDVTRQSVSKWESGQTYPEMDKLLAICKIFDCSLEELTNDEISFKDFNKDKRSNFQSFVDSVLELINKTYNYFTHITFKEFIKCILTMLVLFILIKLFRFPFDELEYIIEKAFSIIRSEIIYNYLTSMFKFIIEFVYLGLGIFLFVYIFKIGFLDKLEIVTDNQTEDIARKGEANINDEKDKKIIKEVDNKKFKVKYLKSDNDVFNILGKIVMIFVKIFLVFLAVPFTVSIIMLSSFLAINISLMFKGVILIGLLLGLIFIIMLNSLVIEFICNIVLDRKHNVKKMVIVFLGSVIGLGISAGICAIEFSSYSFIEGASSNLKLNKSSYSFEYKDNMYLGDYYNINYVVDNSLKKDIKIDVECFTDYVNIYPILEENVIIFENKNTYFRVKDIADLVIKDLKNKEIHSYEFEDMSRITVTASEEVIKFLKENNINNYKNAEIESLEEELRKEKLEKEKLNDDVELYEDKIDSLEERINECEEKNDNLEATINGYKERISSIIE